MRAKITILTVLLVLMGCGSQVAVIETVDEEFYDSRINKMTGNALIETPPSGVDSVELNAERYTSAEGTILYNLVVEYSSSDWLFVKEGESLILIVDGQRIGLKGKGSGPHRDIAYGGRRTEKAWYGVSLDILKMITNAETVKVTIIGSRRSIDRDFTQENFENFRRFVQKLGT